MLLCGFRIIVVIHLKGGSVAGFETLDVEINGLCMLVHVQNNVRRLDGGHPDALSGEVCKVHRADNLMNPNTRAFVFFSTTSLEHK